MKKKELSQILIKELPYYSGSSAYAQTFRTHGIETVDKLFDEKLMNAIINNSHLESSKNETRALIDLASAEFFHKPLPNDKFLSRRISTIKKLSERDYRFDIQLNKKEVRSMDLEEFCRKMALNTGRGVLPALDVINNNVDVRKKLRSGELRVIDFMKIVLDSDEVQWGLMRRYSGIKTMAGMYRTIINSYIYTHSKKKNIKIAPGAIKVLKKELTEINKVMAELEIKREGLEKQILEYEDYLEEDDVESIKPARR